MDIPENYELSTKALFPTNNPDLLQRIDEFRREYELLHGPTPTNIRYTTQMRWDDQLTMYVSDPSRYFAGMPPFVIAYYEDIVRDHANSGSLDDVPDRFLEVYMKNKGSLTPKIK